MEVYRMETVKLTFKTQHNSLQGAIYINKSFFIAE